MMAYLNGIQLYISPLYSLSHLLSLKVGIRMGIINKHKSTTQRHFTCAIIIVLLLQMLYLQS